MSKTLTNILSTFIKNKYILLIFLFALILRLIFLSPYLEDWDSVQFAQAIDYYSMADHKPHPPGYILYIALTKTINFFVANNALSLLLISSFFGSAIVLPFYFLVKQITNKFLAILTSIILISTPIEWTLSEVALSNIVGLFWTTTSSLLLYLGIRNKNYLYLGSFIAGLTLGFRFAEYSILLSLLLLITLYKQPKYLIKTWLLFICGVLVWFIPLLVLTTPRGFLDLYINQASYIINHDSLNSADSSLKFRLIQIKELLKIGYSIYFLPVFLVVFLYILRRVTEFKSITISFVFSVVWLFSYLVPLIFIYNLEVPRHILPLLPPTLLIFALALNSYQKVLQIVFIPVIIFLFITSLEQVKMLHSLTPPTISPVLYTKDNFDPKKTLLITTFTYRQFQFYAKEFPTFYGNNNLPKTINTEYVIIDFIDLKNQISSLSNYKITNTIEFSQDKTIFPRIHKTTLYILEKE